MVNFLNYEKDITPIIETFFETEKIDYNLRFRTINAVLYFKEYAIAIQIDKEYCKGEKFVAKNNALQNKVDEILNLGFRYYSWVEEDYRKKPQLTLQL